MRPANERRRYEVTPSLIGWAQAMFIGWLGHHCHWFREWFVACSAPNHSLNQCRLIANWTFRNKYELYWNTMNVIQENAFQISSAKCPQFRPSLYHTASLPLHYIDVIKTTMASQITSLTVVYWTVYSDADQRIHQSSASLAFVREIHRDRWIPRTKGQLRGRCFHLMTSSCTINLASRVRRYATPHAEPLPQTRAFPEANPRIHQHRINKISLPKPWWIVLFLLTQRKTNIWCVYFHKPETFRCLNWGIIFVDGRWPEIRR